MSTQIKQEIQDFTLVLNGPDIGEQPYLDMLYEAGCDQALLGTGPNPQYADFGYEAPTFEQAVLGAIADVEGADIPHLEVISVNTDEPISAAEIARKTGRSRESIRLLIAGRRGPGGFPQPINPRIAKKYWHWSEVVRWFADALGEEVDDPERAEFVAAVNAQLEARRRLARLKRDDRSKVARLGRPKRLVA